MFVKAELITAYVPKHLNQTDEKGAKPLKQPDFTRCMSKKVFFVPQHIKAFL